MRMPPRLVPLIECGIIDAVVRPLLSGKEAQVYLVESGGELRAAKVYKDANNRSFHNKSSYTEGRTVRNSRDQRAMTKRTRYGRQRDEVIWNAAEADTIYKLHGAGVRVPKPHAFIDGVLVMECIEGPNGGPAPRVAECELKGDDANEVFTRLISEVVKMLCADIVHADLSVYNVLLEEQGPVIIDFPQSIVATRNRNAKKILLRDVANITAHFGGGRPLDKLRFGHEMWDLYENGELGPDTVLTGEFDLPKHEIDAEALVDHMRQLEEEEALADEDGEFDYQAFANSGEVFAPTGQKPSASSAPKTPPPRRNRRRRRR